MQPLPIWLLSPFHSVFCSSRHPLPCWHPSDTRQLQLRLSPLPQILCVRRELWQGLAFHLPLPNQQLLFPFTLKATSECYQLLRRWPELEIHGDLGWATRNRPFGAAVGRYSCVSHQCVAAQLISLGKGSPAAPAEVARSQHWVEQIIMWTKDE